MQPTKRTKLSRSSSKLFQQEDQKISILANDLALLNVLNEVINYAIIGFKNIRGHILLLIGIIVTMYSLRQIELKINFIFPHLIKLAFFNWNLVILFVIIGLYVKTHGYQLIECIFKEVRNKNDASSDLTRTQRLVNVIKRKENLIQFCLIFLISLSGFIFYMQMLSINNLHKKLLLKKENLLQVPIELDSLNQSENSTNSFQNLLIETTPIAFILNGTEYEKNKVLYDDVFDKINVFRKHFHPTIETKNLTVKRLKGKCIATSFENLMVHKSFPKCNAIKKKLIRKKNNIMMYRKVQQIWINIFKTIILIYTLLLTAYHAFSYFKLFQRKKCTSAINESNSSGESNSSRSSSTSFNNNDHECQTPQHQLYQKNKSGSIKKVASVLSIKSENVKHVKLLQKLQQKNGNHAEMDSIDNNNNNINSTPTHDFEPFKWLLNGGNKNDLLQKLNEFLKTSVNDYLKTEVSFFYY